MPDLQQSTWQSLKAKLDKSSSSINVGGQAFQDNLMHNYPKI